MIGNLLDWLAELHTPDPTERTKRRAHQAMGPMRSLTAIVLALALTLSAAGTAEASHAVLVRYDIYTSLTSSDDFGSAIYWADGRWRMIYINDGFEAVSGYIQPGETARVYVEAVMPGCSVSIGVRRVYGGRTCQMPYPQH